MLFLDIENSPNTGYTWDKYEQTVIDFVEQWYLLCCGYKWRGERSAHVLSLPDFVRLGSHDDRKLCLAIHKLLNEADIVVAHNGKDFDQRKINARFAHHSIKPPSPYKLVDTLKIARSVFKFNSNKLDDLGAYLGVGRKVKHEGFELWLRCMGGDEKAWRKMIHYCRNDVTLLERIYDELLPWDAYHPNITLGQQKGLLCPACGSNRVQQRGWTLLKSWRTQRFQCQSCGRWSKGSREKLPAQMLN